MSDSGSDVKDFLKGYAGFIKENGDTWKEYAPFRCSTEMAAGAVVLRDKNGNVSAVFTSDYAPDGQEIPYNPSMPVMPHAIGLCKTVREILNAVAKGE